MARLARPAPFDRTQDFVALRPLTLGGRQLVAGDPVDKTLLTTRTLRALHNQRRVVGVPGSGEPVEPQLPRLRIRHMRFGKYEIVRNGEGGGELLSKEDAENAILAAVEAGEGVLATPTPAGA